MDVGLAGLLDLPPAMVWTALPDGKFDFVNRDRPGPDGQPPDRPAGNGAGQRYGGAAKAGS